VEGDNLILMMKGQHHISILGKIVVKMKAGKVEAYLTIKGLMLIRRMDSSILLKI
jgi:hypothetical protein